MKTVKKSRVTRITVARLYNLGNYEHVRYEITTEVPSDSSPKQALLDTLRIVCALKPVKQPCDLEGKKKSLQKDTSELSESEKASLPKFLEDVTAYNHLINQRNEALLKLDDIGGVSVKTDAKNNWDDIPF